MGLKQMLGDIDIDQNGDSLGPGGTSEKSPSSSSYSESRLGSEESRRMHHSPSPTTVR